MKRRAPGRSTSTLSRSPESDPTTAYANAVVAGKIVAGQLVIAAARRHLRDLKDGARRGLVWRPDKAAHALEFYPTCLIVTAGSRAGSPFVLLDWMRFVTGSLFGWYRTSDRLRFRRCWIETGKGQAKSPFMAATGLYVVGFRGVPRAEGYAIAWDKDQANVPFKDAVAMCRAPIPGQDDVPEALRETLESRGTVTIRGTLDNCWKIEFPETGSKLQSVANNENLSGPRPVFIQADEVHEYKSNALLETWARAIAKEPGDALMMMATNTPSADQIVATEYSEYYQKVALGEIQDDEALVYIARVDVADREGVFENEAVWINALPALGITFPIENIRGEVATARHLLSTANSVRRLYFGHPVGVAGFWISEEAWEAVQGTVNPVAMRGRPCWLSLDLSRKNDLTALTAVWVDERGHLYARTYYWTTKDGLADRSRADNAPYDQWVGAGHITAVPGSVIDKTFVAAEVKRLCAEHDVRFLAFDVAMIGDFLEACEAIGFPVWRWQGADKPQLNGLKLVSHAQGKRVVFEDRQLCMPRSIERLEDAILNGTITIDSSPVTYSCAANAQVDADGQGNRCFDKKRSRGRIDSLVTLTMAIGSATMAEPEDPAAAFSRMIVARGGLV
jgi:phage terminase large subunit-like protein